MLPGGCWSARLSEQLGNEEPGDAAGAGGEPDNKEDDADDGQVGHGSYSLLE